MYMSISCQKRSFKAKERKVNGTDTRKRTLTHKCRYVQNIYTDRCIDFYIAIYLRARMQMCRYKCVDANASMQMSMSDNKNQDIMSHTHRPTHSLLSLFSQGFGVIRQGIPTNTASVDSQVNCCQAHSSGSLTRKDPELQQSGLSFMPNPLSVSISLLVEHGAKDEPTKCHKIPARGKPPQPTFPLSLPVE